MPGFFKAIFTNPWTSTAGAITAGTAILSALGLHIPGFDNQTLMTEIVQMVTGMGLLVAKDGHR